MKLFRKITDERQESEAMRVAAGSFQIVMLGLVFAIIIQGAMGLDRAHVSGEVIVLLIGWICSSIGSIHRGIWDGFTKPGIKSYITYSLAFGIVFGLINPLIAYFRHCAPLSACLWSFAKLFIIIFAVLFVLLLLLGTVIKTRQRKLQMKYEDDDKGVN